jgi:predicted RNA-binding Zn ribbon-like protein
MVDVSKPKSAGLDLVIDFVNTNDLEDEDDGLATPARLAAWASERGFDVTTANQASHARALALREGLRALGRANNDEVAEPEQLAALAEATAALPLTALLATGSRWELRPEAAGIDAFLATIVATVLHAMADGSWSRVKACQNDTCRWLFMDVSRNRSRQWCTMAICGSRMKARAYRARQRASA